MTLLLFILILSPVITYLIHILLIRLVKEKPSQLTAVLSILIGNIPIVLICLTLQKVTVFVYSLIVYNSLAYVYFHIFNMSETARRIHLLVDLKKNGRLKKEDILKRYSPEDIVDIRLIRLLSLRQLRLEDNLYKIDRSFLLIAARIYSFWEWLLSFNIADFKTINSIRK